jgi:hypothetical protein
VRRLLTGGLAVAAALAALLPGAAAAKPKPAPLAPRLANGCFALRSATGGFLSPVGDTYRADQPAGGFFWKPATLASYLPQDRGGRLLAVRPDGAVVRADGPGPATAWGLRRIKGNRVAVYFFADGRQLATSPTGDVSLLPAGSRDPARVFTLMHSVDCTPFPEADVGATGRPFRGTTKHGNVVGFADMHIHITANQRAGGLVLSGEPFPSGRTMSTAGPASRAGRSTTRSPTSRSTTCG